MTSSSYPPPLARRIDVPLKAHSIPSPIVTYGGELTSINFETADDHWGRVTFEKLDSIRASRGEHEPYESIWNEGDPYGWVFVVENSPWLRERYEYEREQYGECYGFGGDVDEMPTDFSHYVFRFHDEFVEALASGICFEASSTCLGSIARNPDHPLLDLPETNVSSRFEVAGIICQLRESPKRLEDLLVDARLCSQTIMQFAAELDGVNSVSWTVDIRVRDGVTQSSLRSNWGAVGETFDGVANLTDVQPTIDLWLNGVAARRRGK